MLQEHQPRTTAADRGISRILSEMAGLAESQLSAARSLDVKRLGQMNARRMDLIFDLEVARLPTIDQQMSPEDKLEIARIQALDNRIACIAGGVLETVSDMIGTTRPPTYGRNGRLTR